MQISRTIASSFIRSDKEYALAGGAGVYQGILYSLCCQSNDCKQVKRNDDGRCEHTGSTRAFYINDPANASITSK